MLGCCQASFSVELLDVAALHFIEAPGVPYHHYIALLLRGTLRVHAALHRETVALARVALGAGRNHVVPGVRSAARDRLDVVARKPVAAGLGARGASDVLAT